MPYWSFSAWAKLKVKNAVNFIGSFERELAAEARKRGVDGVVCGHIHHPVIREMEGVIYVNTGDFVESCSLVVEHHDGRFEVLRWKDPLQLVARVEDNAPFEDEAPVASGRGAGGSGLMRILIATDAWRPQVNGVVSTLERMTQAAAEFGAEFEFLTPQGMWTAPLPSYPEIRLAIPIAGDGSASRIEEADARPYPYRHRRPDRLADAALLPPAQAHFHHQLPHPLSRIRIGADPAFPNG